MRRGRATEKPAIAAITALLGCAIGYSLARRDYAAVRDDLIDIRAEIELRFGAIDDAMRSNVRIPESRPGPLRSVRGGRV